MELNEPHRELSFRSGIEASRFFGYKRDNQIGTYISVAKTKGKNTFTARGTEYLFSVEE